MKKTLISILSVAVMSISFVACSSQVDLVDNIDSYKSASATFSLPTELTQGGAAILATRVVCTYDTAFAYSTQTPNLKTGFYKFYAVGYNSSYSFENLKVPSSVYHDSVYVAYKNYANANSYSPISGKLSGKLVNPDAPLVYADSTMVVELKPNVSNSVSFGSAYALNQTYSVNASVKNSTGSKLDKVYIVFTGVYTKKRIDNQTAKCPKNGSCVLNSSDAIATGKTGTLALKANLFGLASTGSVTVYGCSGSKVAKQTATYTTKTNTITITSVTLSKFE